MRNSDKKLFDITNTESDSFEKLLDEYRPLMYSIINQYNLECGDYLISGNDLYQEASVGLYEASKLYDAEKGVKFSTFAYLVMKRRISRYVAKQRSSYQHETISIDNFERQDYLQTIQSTAIADNPVEYHHLVERIYELQKNVDKLTPIDRKIVKMRLNDYSYEQIANKLGISKKKVDNRIARIKKRAKNRN